MRLLLPEPQDPVTDNDLLHLYAWPTDRVLVRANMVTTIDGAISGAGGTSGAISSRADKRVFHLLRGTADAIVVGAGTVVAEDYGPVRHDAALAEGRAAAGQAALPVICIVSNRASVRPDARVFSGGPGSTLMVVSPAADSARLAALRQVTEVVTLGAAGSRTVALAELSAMLARRGLSRQLVEGGPTLLGGLSSTLDELCLTTSPILEGATTDSHGSPGGRILAGHAPPVHRDATLAHLLEADGALMSRWVFS